MIHKQGSDTKNVVALLSKEPIKQQLLDLINNTKIIENRSKLAKKGFGWPYKSIVEIGKNISDQEITITRF